jgi:hypothetical protein
MMEAKTAIDWLLGVLGAVMVPGLVWAGMILGLILIVRDKLREEHSSGCTLDPEATLLTMCQLEKPQGEIESGKLQERES